MADKNFWRGKRVLVTGHTGFKGSWLCLVLHELGAEIIGYALNPLTTPSMFELCKINKHINSIIGDIRDLELVKETICKTNPEIVLHLAAQSLVRESYLNPVETYAVNIMGTVNLLEAVRGSTVIKAVVNITSDKCYENMEWPWGYRENDSLGGYDPYSNSKACSELVTVAYRNSFFNLEHHQGHALALATARAGNVIGGGDWATDRLIPDCIRALLKGEPVIIRSPSAIRPWQHVLEPLSGYLTLAQKLYESGLEYSGGWNFGPADSDAKPVEWVVSHLCSKWERGATYRIDQRPQPHEANHLKLDCSKAKNYLGWVPKWDLEQALTKTIEWVKAYADGVDLNETSLHQIRAYFNL
jgi:CDP-glucose 4,6-dehydratase